MPYQRGDRVEISSKEEGFEGSYYTANIISRISKHDYIIQYRTILRDDGFGPLREVVSADQIRPLPDQQVSATRFPVGAVVDAYEKDGWWVGKVSEKAGTNYLVYFENTTEELGFPLGLLRVHQNWVNGAWVPSRT